jgi:hypothetical protein
MPRSSKLYAWVSSKAVFAEPMVPYLKYNFPLLSIMFISGIKAEKIIVGQRYNFSFYQPKNVFII